MIDSVPKFSDHSSGFAMLGTLGVLVALVAAILIFAWFVYITEFTPSRRATVITVAVGLVAVAGSVLSFTHGSDLSSETEARQIEAIAEGWDLAPEDAAVLLHEDGSFLGTSGSYVKVEGKTQRAWLYSQYNRYLLMRGDNKVVPISH